MVQLWNLVTAAQERPLEFALRALLHATVWGMGGLCVGHGLFRFCCGREGFALGVCDAPDEADIYAAATGAASVMGVALGLATFALLQMEGQYGKAAYWDRRYQRSGGDATFEWFQSYATLQSILQAELRRSDRILDLGCGTSSLSQDMHADGFESIVGVDISATCIAQMKRRCADKPGLSWHVMDCTNLSGLDDASFDAVLDKGTLDALSCGSRSSFDKAAVAMCAEITRVTRCDRAVYVVISMNAPSDIALFLTTLRAAGWSEHPTRTLPAQPIEPTQTPSPARREHYVYVFSRGVQS